jgi:transposase
VLGVSLRQAQRLVARYRDGGGGALIHKSRGRSASNKLALGVRELVLELVRQNYRDFGPTLAAEVLLERHGVEVSRGVDGRGWHVVVTQTAQELPSAETAT